MSNQEHTKDCASGKPKYYGDARNQFPDEKGECDCDGYHSFDELYEHRHTLFIALCKTLGALDKYEAYSAPASPRAMCPKRVWRSKLHFDGTTYDGWFILGIGKIPGSQMSYHLPLSKWEETNFAETLPKAPTWDGHTSKDVLDRIKNLLP